mgnify:CR=1 FL=1
MISLTFNGDTNISQSMSSCASGWYKYNRSWSAGVNSANNTGATGFEHWLTATASHIAKTEVVRSTESFSDVVRGLHVFGRKVLRPEAIVRAVVDVTA